MKEQVYNSIFKSWISLPSQPILAGPLHMDSSPLKMKKMPNFLKKISENQKISPIV